MKAPDTSGQGSAGAQGPDPLALIQAFEDHFSCCVEWMRLRNEGFFSLRRHRRRQTRAAAVAPKPPSG